MALTNITILALRGLGKKARQRIADAGEVSVITLNRWIRENHKNLTYPTVQQAIKKELNTDSEILEDTAVEVAVK